jgi:hypothetical protein
MFALLAGVGQGRAVLLNEIMNNPAGPEHSDEYIELLGNDEGEMDLAGWSISDGQGVDPLVAVGGVAMILPPGGLALILDADYAGAYDHLITPGTLLLTVPNGALGSNGLSNSSPEMISLYNRSGALVDEVLTRPSLPEAVSLERRCPLALCDSCWVAAEIVGGTPGQPNSVLPRRLDLRARVVEDGLHLIASGGEGFRGMVELAVGQPPCQAGLRLDELDLPARGERTFQLPPMPLAGGNPLLATSLAEDGNQRLLLDTLLWAAAPGRQPFIEVVQPNGVDWVQVALPDSCPCLLDGLFLEGRGFRLRLGGWLPPRGRLLAGAAQAVCADALHVPGSLVLAREGSMAFKRANGLILDAAVWPTTRPAQDAPWRRLDAAAAGDDPGNWVADPSMAAGCPGSPIDPGTTLHGAWLVNTLLIRPGVSGQDLLVIENQRFNGRWVMEIWTLDGERLERCEPATPRFAWNGLVRGRRLPSGVYLLRLEDGARTCLHAMAVQD